MDRMEVRLDERSEQWQRALTRVFQLLTGNGRPEQGMVNRMSRVESTQQAMHHELKALKRANEDRIRWEKQMLVAIIVQLIALLTTLAGLWVRFLLA